MGQGAKRAAAARKKLETLGIDVHDPRNGVILPRGFHNTIHTNKYYDDVNEAILDATTADEALEIIDSFREKLQKAAKEWLNTHQPRCE